MPKARMARCLGRADQVDREALAHLVRSLSQLLDSAQSDPS
jgi:hypothetical protein